MKWDANKGVEVAEEEFRKEMNEDEDEVEGVEKEESLLLEGWAFSRTENAS